MPTETLAPDHFAKAVVALCPDGPPRAWSLIVTVLGDMGGEVEIGAAPLARILACLGVSGAALRVALHRLKADDWIVARRVGRSSAYRLHPDRLTETQAASARIYASAGPEPTCWHLLALSPDDPVPKPAREVFIPVAPRLILRPGPPQGAEGALALRPEGDVPNWLRAAVGTDEMLAAYRALHTGLQEVEALATGRALQPVETAALRVLVVHAWRRVILKHPDLPDALFPPAWCGAECRARVQALLTRLPRPDAQALAAL